MPTVIAVSCDSVKVPRATHTAGSFAAHIFASTSQKGHRGTEQGESRPLRHTPVKYQHPVGVGQRDPGEEGQ